MFAGTLGGLVQDALSSGVIGIGGLAKTIVGFLAGVVGTQFIVAQPLPRFVVFFGATIAARRDFHRAVRAAGPAAVRHARMPRSRARRSATRSSAWWRSSSSSSCRERSSGGGRSAGGSADEEADGLMIEERRRLGVRLTVLQDLITVLFSALAVSFWVLQVVRAREIRGDGGEQPPADARAAGAARAGLRPQRPGARREPPLLQHLDRPRAHAGISIAPSVCWPACSAWTRREVRGHRRPPPARAAVPADHDRRRTRRSRRSRP